MHAQAQPPSRYPWVALIGLVVVVGYVVLRELSSPGYDDSYFFKRFALHAVEHGVYAWNLDDGPVHGSTSQLFQLWTTAVVLFTKTHFVATVRVLDGLLLVGAGAVMLHRARRAPGLVVLAVGNTLVLSGIQSNMETCLALLTLAGALVLALRPRPHEATVVALTVLVYLARPDAAAIVGVFVVVRQGLTRRVPWRYGVGVLLAMAAVWAGLRAYYGTALPLSFHMKTMALHSYGPHMSATRWSEKVPSLWALGLVSAPLWWTLVRARVWRRRDEALALSVAALVFIGYHALSTHEIMGYRARFYVPALVPLALAAARVWTPVSRRASLAFVGSWVAVMVVAVWLGWAPGGSGSSLTAIPWPAYAGIVAGWLCLVHWPAGGASTCVCVGLGTVLWLPPTATEVRSDPAVMHAHAARVTTSRGVFDVARCLPPGSTVYHSEMGIPGLALYRMRVVDLVGLLSRDVALRGPRFQERCAAERPEAIFLPHRNYRALNDRIRASACFQDYVRVVDHSSSPLHVRADLAPAFLACGVESRRWRQAPADGTLR